MKNLEIRLNALKELCDKLGIENVDYHRIYVVTMYPDSIKLQGHYSSALAKSIASNFKDSVVQIDSNGYINVNFEFLEEKIEIVLT
jgi:hypothetical protein